jgi:hypothetical protein
MRSTEVPAKSYRARGRVNGETGEFRRIGLAARDRHFFLLSLVQYSLQAASFNLLSRRGPGSSSARRGTHQISAAQSLSADAGRLLDHIFQSASHIDGLTSNHPHFDRCRLVESSQKVTVRNVKLGIMESQSATANLKFRANCEWQAGVQARGSVALSQQRACCLLSSVPRLVSSLGGLWRRAPHCGGGTRSTSGHQQSAGKQAASVRRRPPDGNAGGCGHEPRWMG